MSYQLETQLAQTGNRKDPATGAVSLPIHLSTAYIHPGIGQSTGYDYSRTANPTRTALEEALALLERGDSGFAFSSGMAAVHAVLQLFKSGDELIVSEDLYGGSYRLFHQLEERTGLNFKYVDTTLPNSVEKALTTNSKAIFIESPTNPLMKETDIEAIAHIAKSHNILLIVDNTFYTPILQQPITLGADIVIHSATKYLGGHNDVLAGAVITKGQALAEQLTTIQNSIGAVPSPLDCWLLVRSLKTLGLRVERQQSNAQALAAFLQAHPAIDSVLYPGQGGMLSFRLQREEWVPLFLERLELIAFAESLGGVESFITYPTTQTHADIPVAERERVGICARLLRFSVGIEHVQDLQNELQSILDGLVGEDS
ncbi:aminotransferase class I/II-fold pyridoxal phosphate-dependent enzyme [Chryseomicrobium sp. FSL W7-1435]|uniref:aminotransferase class I/II-fold pyridoxal phosphate-dependent enzyme n=1 Tax=Chryseomicrobium sp. FSL W7-1435 TaxID=2921704 RepID=UPI00315B3016